MARTFDEMIERENPEIVAQARAKADKTLLEIHRKEIRSELRKIEAK